MKNQQYHILLEEIVGEKEINPKLKQIFIDPIYGKRAKFLFDKGIDENIIFKSIDIDKKNDMKNKAVVWLARELKRNINGNNMPGFEAPSDDDFREIFDYIRSTGDDLMKYDFESALSKSVEWHAEMNSKSQNLKDSGLKYETNNVIFKGSGFNIVELQTRKDLDVEGKILGVCTAEGNNCGYYYGKMKNNNYKYFSLRDNNNEPHVLMEFTDDGVFEQIQGKGNNAPVDKYKQQLYEWLSTEAPANAKLTEIVIERVMPKDKYDEFIKQIEEKIIKELESE